MTHMQENHLADSLPGYAGQTVTIFTGGGGHAGSGFTGVLMDVRNGWVKLITSVGAPYRRQCADDGLMGMIGSLLFGWRNRGGVAENGAWLGTITEIPIKRIVGFTHYTV
jgi:hypothetical protein